MTTEQNKQWSVTDSNARTSPRFHDIPTKINEHGEVIMTKSYALSADTPTNMPEDHARMFLTDSAFIVLNDKGDHITPVIKREGGMGNFKLGENELIAEYDEISKEALFKRCKILAGSDNIKERLTPKEEMITFLKGHGKNNIGRSRGSEGVIGEMNPAELDSLLDA